MGSVGPTDSVHCSTTAAVSLVFFSLLGAVCPLLAVMVLLVTLLLVVLLLVEGGTLLELHLLVELLLLRLL